MDDDIDDRWIHDLLDDAVPDDELRLGFEDALRGDLRRAWRKTPSRPPTEVARRRKLFLGAACAAAIVIAIAAVVVLRPDGKSSIYSPVESDQIGTSVPTPSSAATDPTTSTEPSTPMSTEPESTEVSVPVVATASSVLLKLDNGAPRLPATRVVLDTDLGTLDNVALALAPDGQIVLAHDVDGRRRLSTVTPAGDLANTGIELSLGATFLFGPHGDLYTLERPTDNAARISEYHLSGSGSLTWVASADGADEPGCVLEFGEDGAKCGRGIVYSSGDSQAFDRVVADASLGAAEAQATITRTGGAVEHVWTTQLQMQRALSCGGDACVTALFPGPSGAAVWTPPASDGQPDRAVFVMDDRDTAGAAWLDPSIDSVVGTDGDELIAIRHLYGARTLVAVDLTSIVDPSAVGTQPDATEVDSGRPGLIPACGETVSARGGSSSSVDDAALESFGPLGASPSIDVRLPLSRSEFSTQIAEPTASPAMIPGGILVLVTAPSTGYFPGSMLAAIDIDGSVRWVRCFPDYASGLYTAPTSTDPTSTYVLFSKDLPDRSAPPTFRLDRVSLTDGAVVETTSDQFTGPDDGSAVVARPIAQSATALLFGPPQEAAVGPTSRLVRLQLATGEITSAPYPSPAASGSFSLGDHDEVVLLGANNGMRAEAVFADGQWTIDPDTVAATGEVHADFTFDDGSTNSLKGLDGAGRVLWTDPSIVARPTEGFVTATSGAVSIVRGCTSVDEGGGGCIGPAIWGVDALDGQVLWRLDGVRNVTAVANGYALVTDAIGDDGSGGSWMMIDLETGQPIDGQLWTDPKTFESQCCGGGESVYVSRAGAVVFAANGDHIAVWYPAAESIPTVRVTLP